MTWTAWNDGKWLASGAGYGLKVGQDDRDRLFDRSWATVQIELPTANGFEVVDANVAKPSFWGSCRELINVRIGRWLIARGLAPWPSGHPPKLTVEVVGDRRFRVLP